MSKEINRTARAEYKEKGGSVGRETYAQVLVIQFPQSTSGLPTFQHFIIAKLLEMRQENKRIKKIENREAPFQPRPRTNALNEYECP